MATNRVRQIYQSAALFASPSPATGFMKFANTGASLLTQIPRVQSVGLSFNVPRVDVNQFGQLAALDRIITEPPTCSLDFTYLILDGYAENKLGFEAKGGSTFISGLLSKATDEKNYFIQISSEGVDAVGSVASGTDNVISLGNGFISNYSLSLAVGQLPQASVTVEGLNVKFDTGTYGKITPAVNPVNGQSLSSIIFDLPVAVAYTGASIVSALRPGDLTLELPANAGLGNILSGNGAVHVQSINFSVPLSREPINQLGSTFAFSRETTFPINSTLAIEALAADLRESNLADILCNDQSYNFKVRVRQPNCSGAGAEAVVLSFNNAKLESQDYNLDIGGNATTTLNFTAQIAGVGDNSNGFFFSGNY